MENRYIESFRLSRADIRSATGVSLSVIDDAIRAGHLKSFLIGRRRYTRPQYVRQWVDYLESESDAGRPVHYRRGGGQVAALIGVSA